jgi:putative glycosyltransferase (TIGR04348 family)
LSKPHIVIISPASAKANNGNWQTAYRWTQFLREQCRVRLLPAAEPKIPATAPDAIVALHARRSAHALAAFKVEHPHVPAVLVLTGTDLYRDIHADAEARQSLQLADRLVVLQEAGLRELDASLHEKTEVIHQSAPALKPVMHVASARYADIVMIGHLRDEKDPLTYMCAAGLVASPRVRLLHIGGTLDPALGRLALTTQNDQPRYRWLGCLPHAQTRQRLKRSRLMVISSRMEGGANVITEAVTSGVPVLASDIPGNRGMLGDDYGGYFPVGDSATLAQLIDRAIDDPAFYYCLKTQCAARAPLFLPEREKAAVLRLMDNLIQLQ